jgi:hypothetical protein
MPVPNDALIGPGTNVTHRDTLSDLVASSDNTCDVDANESSSDDETLDIVTVNDSSGSFPWAYFNPETEGQVTWNCGEDSEGKIVSIFSYNGGGDASQKARECTYLKDFNEALHFKNTLVQAGWQPTKPPKIDFTIDDGKGGQRPLNRKERRFFQRKIRQGKDITETPINGRRK